MAKELWSYKLGNEEINVNTCNLAVTFENKYILEHDKNYTFILYISYLLDLYFVTMKIKEISSNDFLVLLICITFISKTEQICEYSWLRMLI